jgi:apolipoprotein N-acyltransferase
LLLVASFPKFGHPAFGWIALAPLLVAIGLEARRPPIRVLTLGLITAGIYFSGTLYWVSIVVATFGGLGMPLGILVGILMVASQAIFPAFFALLQGYAFRSFGVKGVWLAPFLWVTNEWLRATLGFAFPWVMLGTSQSRVLPIVQAASVVGVYGLSFLLVLVSAAAAAVTLSRRRPHVVGAAVTLVSIAVIAMAGAVRVQQAALLTRGRPLRVGLVQGNVPEEEKLVAGNRDAILTRYIDLSRRTLALGADVVLWPESSAPFYFDLDTTLAAPVRRLAAETHTPFVIGSDEFERWPAGDRYYNSAVLVDADGRSRGSYRKMRLVPFGEYVPLKSLLFFVGPLVQAVSDFTPGTEPRVFDIGGSRRLSVAICYESVYPWIGRAFVERGSQLLATITNDAWFGRSSAAFQHFDQGAIRAVEEGRYVVRAANTGISGAVDPYGRAVAATDLFVPAAFVVDVRLLSDLTWYGRLGDVVVWLGLAVALGVLLVTWNQRRFGH